MKTSIHKLITLSTVLSGLMLTATAARADVKAQVLHVKVKLTEQNVTQVHVQGIVQNTESLPVRDVQIKVNLVDPDKNPIRSFLLNPFEHLESNQTDTFEADYLLRDYEPLYIQATAELSYTPTSYFQIADWIINRNWTNLALWRVPLTSTLKGSERVQVDTAIDTLEKIPPTASEAYADARRKINLIHYNYGKRLVESKEHHEAILRLANVEDNSIYGQEAQTLVESIRIKTIFERAMDKAVRGHYRGAYRQMMYVPEHHELYTQAQQKREEWQEILKAQHISLGPTEPPHWLSQDQHSVWLRRQHGPEGYTSSTHSDGSSVKTWWYLDYSYYTFDNKGHLINKQEY